jgi:hypothetical protein
MNVEAVDPKNIAFVTFGDYGNIMAEECRIMVCRCLLRKIKNRWSYMTCKDCIYFQYWKCVICYFLRCTL